MIYYIVTSPCLFPNIFHFPTLLQDPTPSLCNVNNRPLTRIDIHFSQMAFFHGILSLTKYFLCVVGPPLNMYYISFCVYSESLYSFWIVCIVCSALHHFFCFCILFFLYMPGLLELHCTQSGRYTVSYLLLHYCLRSVYKCCRDRKILMKIFLLITLLLFTI